MLSFTPLLVLAAASAVRAVTLKDVCKTSYVRNALPPNGTVKAIKIDASSATAQAIYNTTISDNDMYPNGVIDFCNVTFAYSHDGRDDQVLLNYWLPAPKDFKNRYLSTGGGGLDINDGISTTGLGLLPGGPIYGAVSGATDGGFGSFDNGADVHFLLANGTINWEDLVMFGYQAHHEMTVIGKGFTQAFYNLSITTNSSSVTNGTQKLYTYYQGCSEGGREGLSQVQRFANEWDGAIVGAPAIRFPFQSVNGMIGSVIEQDLNYFPPPCELEKIVNLTITACDALDGKIDGVISRSDLCKIHFNVNSTIGEPYYCAATSGSASAIEGQGASASTPEQNGTVSVKGAAVASRVLEGLKNSQGQQAYVPYNIGASFGTADTQYNSETDAWEVDIFSLGGEYVTRFLELRNTSTLASIEGVTYDTMIEWISLGWQTYESTVQTTWPDLSPFQKAGGKLLLYHGEADPSIPTASSVHYREAVRSIMYPGMSFNASTKALDEFFRFYIVPGAGHCGTNSLQANGPWPQTNFGVMIDWVEKGIAPTTLNATHLAGDYESQNAQLCPWPLRPYWQNNGTNLECQYDQKSLNEWIYKLDAFKVPVY